MQRKPKPPVTIEHQLRDISIKAMTLDGVVTKTASVYVAWRRMLDVYLQQRGKQEGGVYEPLHIAADSRQYIDGIPCCEGVRNSRSSIVQTRCRPGTG